MDNQPKKNTEDELLGNNYQQKNTAAGEAQQTEGFVPDDLEELLATEAEGDDFEDTIDDTDKYLAMEQPGVQYTGDTDTLKNSDQLDYSNEGQGDEWSEEGGNSKNSDAFNQDDYILEDNVDLDEDQNQSISSDDEDFEESNERYTN